MNKINLPITEGAPAASAAMPVTGDHKLAFEVEVVSDVICPWCYVGKRRLERAIQLLGPNARVKVTWKPFQLNPTMPKGGMARSEYRRAKFGSLERSQMLDARLTAVGASEGIEFHLERIARTPNTFDAHRLIWLAQHQDKQDAVVEALFKAYFTDGVDIGETRNLVAIAVSAGIEEEFVEKMLATDEGLSETVTVEEQFKAMGIEGVPSFVVGGVVLFSGAAEANVMIEAFRPVCAGLPVAE
jgi:predicted DsbA family dithiol-disulfide isomerase